MPENQREAFARAALRQDASKLLFINEIFKLEEAEAERLFGVDRQTLDHWLSEGVPLARTVDLDRIMQAASALRERFKADRIPSIVRSDLPGLGKRSILAMLESENGIQEILSMLERLGSFIPEP